MIWLLKYSQDYRQNISSGLDRSPNYGIFALVAPVSSACTLFDRHKHSSLDTTFITKKLPFDIEGLSTLHSNDFYTLPSEDQLPLCPTHGYDGITTVQFPCSRNFVIVGAYNGIFCIREYPKDIFLWNPSIRHKLSIPDCPTPRRIPGAPWAGIGFGFDPINDDYKIVSISFARKSSYVYVVKTSSWCVIASPTPLFYKYLSSETCFLNGVLHYWVIDCYHTESHDTNFPCIMTFDLNTHAFGMIPLPKPFWAVKDPSSLQGFLAVISKNHDADTWIWVRRNDSWSVVFKSKNNQFDGGLITRVLQPTTNSDWLLNTIQRSETILVYNAKTGKQSRLVNFNASS